MKKESVSTSEASKEYEDDEIWEFKVDNDVYILSGAQANAVKSALQSGVRGILWFEDLALNTSYIRSAKMIKRGEKSIQDKKIELSEKFRI